MISIASQVPALGMSYDEIPARNSVCVAHWIDFQSDSSQALDPRDPYYFETCWNWYERQGEGA
ncbi:hypothetical protein LJR232_003102 [Aquipseudomonas alcaligenes]